MRILIFCHSICSDWNHGNAHFLRGVASELAARGHHVECYEPRDSWSFRNLIQDRGRAPLEAFHRAYPDIVAMPYDPVNFDLDAALTSADLVLVHEWNDHDLVRAIGEHRARGGRYRLYFHDTHHRSVTDRGAMARYDLRHYDAVLAFGNVISDLYRAERWHPRVHTWHEAADTRVFHPLPGRPREGDLVWIGNWGDNERSAELCEFLIAPVKALGLRARVYGVRYPESAQNALRDAGIEYRGWLPNFEAPEVFARFGVTVHVPRRPYVQALPGIPTIRIFGALACCIPLVSAPWDDAENLFTPGADFLVARDSAEMREQLSTLLRQPDRAAAVARHGLATIQARHTCAHRADELIEIHHSLENVE